MTMDTWRKAWAVGVAISAGAALAGPAAAAEDTFDRILKEKKVNVCWVSSPPAEMMDPKSGQVTGYLVEAAKFIFKEIGVEPVFVEEKWGTFASSLQSGRTDLCIASSFATIKRSAAIQFTRPLFYLGHSAIVRKGETRFKKFQDLNRDDITIAVLQGSRSQEVVESSLNKAKLLTIGSNDPSAPFLAVTAGRADVGINDAWAARRFAANQPSVTDLFADEPYGLSPLAWSVRPQDLRPLNFINTALTWIVDGGELERMALQYDIAGRYKVQQKLVPFAAKE